MISLGALQAARGSYSHIHNFSLGVLVSYFHLCDYMHTDKGFMLSPNVLLLASRTKRLFVFGYEADDVSVVDQHSKRFPIYSAVKLPLAKERDFVEVAYNLDAVFDPVSYPNSKKRHKPFKNPFTWAAKQGIWVLGCYTASLLEVYEEWVK